jgi:hypothetical protein
VNHWHLAFSLITLIRSCSFMAQSLKCTKGNLYNETNLPLIPDLQFGSPHTSHRIVHFTVLCPPTPMNYTCHLSPALPVDDTSVRLGQKTA